MEFLPKEQCQKVCLVCHFASWYKLYHCAFLWVSYYIQLSYNACVTCSLLTLSWRKAEVFTNCSCSGRWRRDCNTFKRDCNLFLVFFLHCVRPLQNRPTKKLQHKHIPKTGSKVPFQSVTPTHVGWPTKLGSRQRDQSTSSVTKRANGHWHAIIASSCRWSREYKRQQVHRINSSFRFGAER